MKSSNKGWIFASCFYLGVLLAISASAYLKILPTQLSWLPFYDVAMHFILLGLAAFFGHLALNKRRVFFLSFYIPLAPVIVLACCIIDEILQALSPHRSPSIIDLIADLLGIAVFYILAERVRLKSD